VPDFLCLLFEKKVLKEVGLPDAISMVIAKLPELSLDVP